MEDFPLKAVLRAATMLGVTLVALGLMVTPIHPGVSSFAIPDLVFCITCIWVLRRPTQAGMIIVFAIGLSVDLLLGRPTGLGALALVLITEVLRPQSTTLRESSFLLEWAFVSFLLILATLLQSALLWLTLAPSPGLLAQLGQALTTTIAYPVMAFVASQFLGLRYPRKRLVVTPLGEEAV